MQVYVLIEEVEAESANVWVYTDPVKAQIKLADCVIRSEDYGVMPGTTEYENEGYWIRIEEMETDED